MIYFICSITITLKINIYHWFNLIYQIKWILYVCVSSRHLIWRNNNVTLLTAQYCWVFPPYRPSIDPYVVSRCPFLIKARDTLFKAEKSRSYKKKTAYKIQRPHQLNKNITIDFSTLSSVILQPQNSRQMLRFLD